MAMTNCPECHQQCSRKASRCPFCGYPIVRGFLGRPGWDRNLNVAALAVVVIWVLSLLVR